MHTNARKETKKEKNKQTLCIKLTYHHLFKWQFNICELENAYLKRELFYVCLF